MMHLRKGKRHVFTGVLLFLVLLLSLAVLSGCSGARKTKTSEYVGVKLSGLNGEGEISLTFDTEKLISFIQEKKTMTERELEDLENLLKDPEKDFSISRKTNLSNGDEIEITGGFEKNFLKDYKVDLQNDTLKYTVEGLLDKTLFSLNDYVTVSFSGFEGEAVADISLDKEGIRKGINETGKALGLPEIPAPESEPAEGEAETAPSGSLTGADYAAAWLDSLEVYPTRVSGLKAGDEVSADFILLSDRLMDYGIVFTADTVKEKAETVPVETVSLGDYFDLRFTGYDRLAKAEAAGDYDRLAADLAAAFDADGRGAYGCAQKDTDVQKEAEDAAAAVRSFVENYYYTNISQTRDLSNGMEVTLSVGNRWNDGDAGYYLSDIGVILEDCDKTVTVEGLPESDEIYLNDFVQADFDGFEGEGDAYLTIDYTGLREAIDGVLAARTETEEGEENEEAESAEALISSWLDNLYVYPSYFSRLGSGDEISSEFRMSSASIESLGIIFTGDPIAITAVTLPYTTVELGDYFTVSCTGFDRMGYAEPEFDQEKLAADLAKIFTEQNRGAYGVLGEDADVLAEAAAVAENVRGALSRDFSTALSQSTDLSNGDEIGITCVYRWGDDEEYRINSNGILLKNADTTFTVEGLGEVTTVSINDFIRVECTGFDTLAHASIYLDRDALYEYITDLKLEQNPGLRREEVNNSDLNALLGQLTIEETQVDGLSTGDAAKAQIRMFSTKLPSCGVIFSRTAVNEVVTAVPLETVELTKNYLVSFSGYDGIGEANLIFAKTALTRQLEKQFAEHGRGAFGLTDGDADPAEEAKAAVSAIEDAVRRYYTVGLDRADSLSSGDDVVFSALLQDSGDTDLLLQNVGIVLKGGTADIPVIGLKQPEEIDLAEALTITFEGIMPNITVTRTIDESFPFVEGSSIYNAAGSERIIAHNGDTYSGSIAYDPVEYLMRGYKVVNADYSREIRGMAGYQLSITEADDERLAALGEAGIAILEEKQNYGTLRDIALAEGGSRVIWNDMHTAWEGAAVSSYENETEAGNLVFLIYHTVIPVRMQDMTVEKRDMYAVLRTDNLLENADGTFNEVEDWSYALYNTAEEAEEDIRQKVTNRFGGDTGLTSFAIDTADSLTTASVSLEGIRGEVFSGKPYESAQADGELAALAVGAPVNVNGHIYYRFDAVDGEAVSWNEAKAFCEENGGHLLTLQTQKEYCAIRYLLTDPAYDCYWIGGYETEYEGSYRWVTGEPFAWSFADDTSFEEGETVVCLSEQWDGWVMNDISPEADYYGFIMEVEPENPASDLTELADLQTVRSYGTEIYGQVDDPYGDTWFRSIGFDTGSDAVTDYALGGKYAELSGTFSTRTETDSEAVMSLAIWGDGKLLFSQYAVKKVDPPFHFTINVEGVQRLSVQANAQNGGGILFLNDALLTKAAAEDEAEPEVRIPRLLGELPAVYADDFTADDSAGMKRDAAGVYVPDAVDLNTGDGAGYIVRLSGNYTHFTAVLENVSRPEYGAAADFAIYADGSPVYSREGLTARDPSEEISLEVSGVQMLEFRADSGESGISQALRLSRTAFLPAAGEPEAAVIEPPVFPELPEEYADMAADSLAFGSRLYLRLDNALSYADAETLRANKVGGHLALPESPEENQAVRALVRDGLQEGYWLGAKTGGEENELWLRYDGSELDGYTNWEYGQPDNDREEECLLEMYSWDGTWDAASADLELGAVIQLEAVSGAVETRAGLAGRELLAGENMERTEYIYPSQPKLFFPDALRFDADYEGYAVYDLGGAYDSLHLYLLPDRIDPNTEAAIAFFGDGRLLKDVSGIVSGSGLKEVTVDVNGVRELTVRTWRSAGDGSAEILVFGESLTAALSHDAAEKVRLDSQVKVDSKDIEEGNGRLFVDVTGVPHDGYVALRTDSDAYVLYNIAGNYTEFSGTIAAGRKTPVNGGVTVRVLLDNEEVLVLEDYGKLSGAVPFTFDVTGVQTIRFEAVSEENDSWIFITDDRLEKSAGRRRESPGLH